MNEVQEPDTGQSGPSRDPNRTYILVAAVLLVVIIVAAVLLIVFGIPALTGTKEPTATTAAEPSITEVPTFTPEPEPEPTLQPGVMQYPETPAFIYESAGVRPGVEWTGFFGQVVDAGGNPVPGVTVIVWYGDGKRFYDPTQTDQDGNYQIILADAPLGGTWNIQLLTEDGQPASKPFGIQTDTDTETGIQQIQIIWKQLP